MNSALSFKSIERIVLSIECLYIWTAVGSINGTLAVCTCVGILLARVVISKIADKRVSVADSLNRFWRTSGLDCAVLTTVILVYTQLLSSAAVGHAGLVTESIALAGVIFLGLVLIRGFAKLSVALVEHFEKKIDRHSGDRSQ